MNVYYSFVSHIRIVLLAAVCDSIQDCMYDADNEEYNMLRNMYDMFYEETLALASEMEQCEFKAFHPVYEDNSIVGILVW